MTKRNVSYALLAVHNVQSFLSPAAKLIASTGTVKLWEITSAGSRKIKMVM